MKKNDVVTNKLKEGIVEPLHHAYILEGDAETLLSSLLIFLEEELSFAVRGNPDFRHDSYETFGIDESRMLKEAQTHKNINGRRVFIVSFSFITSEAQHALLKVLEEPSSDALFFFIVPSRGVFIPTVLSRTCVVGCSSPALKGAVDMQAFLSGGTAMRFTALKSIIEEKDKKNTLSFLNELQTVLYKERNTESSVFVLKEIESCRNYLNSRAPSVKMILEHIALIAPRT